MELAASLFQDSRILFFPTAALCIFFSILIGAFLWSVRPGSQAFYLKMSLMPFSDEQKVKNKIDEN